MTARSLLFTPDNYNKTSRGVKTMTRRTIKPQPIIVEDRTWTWPCDGVKSQASWAKNLTGKTISLIPAKFCPFGNVGTRLLAIPTRHDRSTGSQPDVWLEITAVRVERLIEINNEDAEKEGCEGRDGMDPYEVFAELWDSIHGEGSWNTNPFCWVISYRKEET